MPRIFVAIVVPEDVSRELAALVPADLEGLKRVPPDLVHLTLAFVGWTEDARLPAITAAAQEAAAGARSFPVGIDGLGRFPPSGRTRVIWAGTGAASADIERLGERVRAELARRQVPFDPKPLRPHLTLGRVRDDASAEAARAIAAAVAAARVPPGLAFRADAIHVVESVLSPRGARYSSRARVPLPDEKGERGSGFAGPSESTRAERPALRAQGPLPLGPKARDIDRDGAG